MEMAELVVAGPSEDFRLTIKRISDNLDSDEVFILKYLCVDYLPNKRFEEIDSGLELFDILCNKNVVTAETTFLAECLIAIRRVDLLQDQLHLSVSDVQRMTSEKSQLNSFRVLIMRVVQYMRAEEVKHMGFVLDGYLLKNHAMYKSGYAILLALERSGNLSPNDLDLLEQVIEQVAENRDAVTAIRNYKAQRQASPGPRESGVGEPTAIGSFGTAERQIPYPHDKENDVPGESGATTATSSFGTGISAPKEMRGKESPLHRKKGRQPLQPILVNSPVQSNKGPRPLRVQAALDGYRYRKTTGKKLKLEKDMKENDHPGAGGHSEGANLFHPPGESWEPKGNETNDKQLPAEEEAMERELEELPAYEIKSDPRGMCIIINNVEFEPMPCGKTLPYRHGSDVDQENLHNIFEKLKFEVEVYRNVSSRGIAQVAKRYAEHDHTEYDCFAFCILSHGARGQIYGTNAESVDISTITEHFRGINCATLRKKPKLFFIQACQGNINQPGFETDNFGDTPALLPNESDFLVGYATPPGYVSYRSETQGSWYISMLVEMLDKYSDRDDLLSIMTKVNEEVAKGSAEIEGGIYKQSPLPQSTLRKKVFLRK